MERKKKDDITKEDELERRVYTGAEPEDGELLVACLIFCGHQAFTDRPGDNASSVEPKRDLSGQWSRSLGIKNEERSR